MARRNSSQATSSFSQYERAGETYDDVSNSPLPRAQERVQQALEREGLIGGMGGTPIQGEGAARAWSTLPTYAAGTDSAWSGKARYGKSPPYRRSLRSQQYAELKSLRMRAPARVLFCQQRKERREVLFAKKRAGFGGSAKKRRWRRTQNSQYGC